jgi:hypothetical protein
MKEFNETWAGAAGGEPEAKGKKGKQAKPKKQDRRKRKSAVSAIMGANVDASRVPEMAQRQQETLRNRFTESAADVCTSSQFFAET